MFEQRVVLGAMQWLLDDLKGVDRCLTPWLIVAMHRPMYVVYPHKSNRRVGEHLRVELEPIFSRYGVSSILLNLRLVPRTLCNTGHVSRDCSLSWHALRR